jgi:SAM-dependent methyltransferase
MKHRGKTYWRRKRDKLIRKHVIPSGQVLDVGCGWRVYSKNAVRLDIRLGCHPDVVADIQEGICFRDSTFDTVLMFDLLEHLESPHRAIEEVKRILKPSGVVYLTVPFCFPRHGREYYRFSDLALKKMFKDCDVQIVPVVKSRFWNLVWNYYPQDLLVEGYFMSARKSLK